MKKYFHLLSPALSIALLSLAGWILWKELSHYDLQDILDRIKTIPARHIVVALALCILNYGVLTMYDVFGLKFANVKLPYKTVAFTSFVSYSLSHNLGFAVFTGGAARLRLLSRFDVGPTDIAKQVAFVSLMFTLGFCALAGVTFISDPPSSAFISARGILLTGFALLGVVAFFFTLTLTRRRSTNIFGFEVPRVPCRMTLLATAIAALDWTLAAAVAWNLFPQGAIAFTDFLGVFLIAQVIGLISHVPGGIGVFEGIMISALAGTIPADSVLGSLLIYRLIYYVIPFIIAIGLYACHETRVQWGGKKTSASCIKGISSSP